MKARHLPAFLEEGRRHAYHFAIVTNEYRPRLEN